MPCICLLFWSSVSTKCNKTEARNRPRVENTHITRYLMTAFLACRRNPLHRECLFVQRRKNSSPNAAPIDFDVKSRF